MQKDSLSLSDIKKLRLERHWSQEQLSELSGLSTRTIQRIEKGEKAGYETLKSLAAVFEIDLTDSEKKNENETINKAKENYVEEIKGIYKLAAIAIISLIVPLVMALNDSSFWMIFGLMSLSWVVIICVKLINTFDFFGEKWKRNLINKKFR
ncbi:MAG: helix-turn-helix transcriptional regulator [Bacteroidales bacterium]|nr:helix-turn-helix transcriptional regulator [Bacteroidales bacterium]